jgi:uncharacterized protein (DUF488 family)
MKNEFLLKSLKHNDSKLKDFKDKIFNEKLEMLLGEDNDNEINSTPADLVIQTENTYPRIFTSIKAFEKFQNLLNEFGISSQDLANYSFVFHRMKKDSLIFKDLKQIEFIDFLSSFEIHLDRLKPKSQLGNIDLRESIYNRI